MIHCRRDPYGKRWAERCSFGCNGERWVVQDEYDEEAWWPGSNGPPDEQVPCPGCNADGRVPKYGDRHKKTRSVQYNDGDE